MAGSQEALDRFERQTAWPMMILAVAIIPLLVVPLLVDLPSGVEMTFYALDWLIWVAFVLEYGIRLYLAPSKRHFVTHNIIDLLFVLIPFLRPLRVFRSARAFALFRATRGMVVLLRAVDAVQDVLRRHKLGYTLLLIVMAAKAALEERPRASTRWWHLSPVSRANYASRESRFLSRPG